MTTVKNYLVVPRTLGNEKSHAFAINVLLSASIANVNLEVVPADANTPAVTLAKSYPLPALVSGDIVLCQSKAAVQHILGEKKEFVNELAKLVLEDRVEMLVESISIDGKMNDYEEQLNQIISSDNVVNQILIFGALRAD